MKVFVTGTRGFPNIQGGIEKHCEELYPRLALMGTDITVSTRAQYVPKEQRLATWKGVKFIHVWSPRLKPLEAIIHTFICVLLARLRSADMLHIHAVGPSLLAPFARLIGLKVVTTHHGPDYERLKWGGAGKFVLRIGEKLGLRFSNGVIAISTPIKNGAMQIYPASNIRVIPNGVTKHKRVSAGELLERLGLTSGAYYFTACRFVPEKALHDLIKAYGMIKNRKYVLVIAGGEDHESEYGRRIDALAHEHGAILAGKRYGTELAELFSNAGLFVLPSYYEGFPIALLEALSYRIPVLVSDIPAHHEIPLQSFRYFEAGNLSDLKNHLEGLATKEPDIEEIEGYGRIVDEEFNWDSIARKTLTFYNELSIVRVRKD